MEESITKRRKLGRYDGCNSVSELIESYEKENLRPRTWELSGEVTAEDRDKDELLDHFIDVDFRAKSAPIITTDTTKNLESIVTQRIKDRFFDDVIRTVKQNEALIPSYHAKTAFDETVRKSLTEIYEAEFKAINSQDELIEPQLDPKVAEVLNDLNGLFKKLDALSHYQFTPPEIKPEVKIVHNMPSFRVEEVGPLASIEPESLLLAPEEVLKHVDAPPMAKEERTDTDRKRERRKKKAMQKHVQLGSAKNSKAPSEPAKNRKHK